MQEKRKKERKKARLLFLGCTNFWQCEKRLILRLLLLALLYFSFSFLLYIYTGDLFVVAAVAAAAVAAVVPFLSFSSAQQQPQTLQKRDTQLCSVTGTKIATRRRRKERIETLLLPPRQQTANKLLETSKHTDRHYHHLCAKLSLIFFFHTSW